MNIIKHIRELMSDQRNAFVASFLRPSLDAFDYFILVFGLKYKAIITAQVLTLLIIALWTFSSMALLTIGAFLMQFMIQEAFAVIAVHL